MEIQLVSRGPVCDITPWHCAAMSCVAYVLRGDNQIRSEKMRQLWLTLHIHDVTSEQRRLQYSHSFCPRDAMLVQYATALCPPVCYSSVFYGNG